MNISDLLLVSARMQRCPTQLKSSLIENTLPSFLTFADSIFRRYDSRDIIIQNLHRLKWLTLFRDHALGNDHYTILVFKRRFGSLNHSLTDLDLVFLTSFGMEHWPIHIIGTHIVHREVHAVIVVDCCCGTQRFNRRQLQIVILIVDILDWLIEKIDSRPFDLNAF